MDTADRRGVVLFLALLATSVAQAQSVRRLPVRRVAPAVVIENNEVFADFGKSVDWAPAGDLIATSRPGFDWFYDVVILNLDGSIAHHLTRARPGCPQKHNGNPVWHPNGRLIVFTAENEDVTGADAHRIAIPGRGVNCNLWLARADGSGFWQLTDYPTDYLEPRAVVHPQLSPDGSTLLWAERVRNRIGTEWGEWALRFAALELDDGPPHLEGIRSVQPGERRAFFEGHDWSRDGSRVLFSGNLLAGQPEYGLDIYQYDCITDTIRRLTLSFLEWDEHAHYSPDGRHITWMSSRGFPIDWSTFDGSNYGELLITELWAMAADGSGAHRLTFFNDPNHPHHIEGIEGCIVSDSAWSPDGCNIVLNVYCRMLDGSRGAQLLMLDVLGCHSLH